MFFMFIAQLYFPDEPYYRPPLSPPKARALKKSPFLRTKTEKCYDL